MNPPIFHEEMLALLEEGLHYHENPDGGVPRMLMGARSERSLLCGTGRCFKLKLKSVKPAPEISLINLTRSQLETLDLLAAGHVIGEIAKLRSCSESTVSSMLMAARLYTGARTTNQLLAWFGAWRNILPPPRPLQRLPLDPLHKQESAVV